MKKKVTGKNKFGMKRIGCLFLSVLMVMMLINPVAGSAANTAEGETVLSTEETQRTEQDSTADTRTGIVKTEVAASAVNVRTGPGTGYSLRKDEETGVIVQVYEGQVVNILEEKPSQSQEIWYHISFSKESKEYEGWIRNDYITVNQTDAPENSETSDTDSSVSDEKFVQSLKEAGFPDSYCARLLALHKKYPKWQFVPVFTGLDWSYAVEKESIAGKNLVESIVNDARKSTASTAYDWATDKWYGYDGADWVSASSEYIAYCMDPRNFFDENYIFQFETLELEPYHNVSGVKNVLKNTFLSGDYVDTDGTTRSYAESFMEIGTGLLVSPYHLAARCVQEQGLEGTSPLISGKYEGFSGYYNHFNVCAYTTSTASAIVNGLSYAKSVGWDSIYESLMGGSSVVTERYVKKGQNTIYFEKFNVVNQENLFSHQYMTNVMAAFKEGSKMSKAYTDKNVAFVFRIPVYKNMPAAPVTFQDNGNPNNWLSALTVEGYTITPSFKPATTEYALIVPDEVSSVNISGTSVSKKAMVSGAGNYTLNYGENIISITCIAENGSSRTYKIKVVREGAETPVTPPTETPDTPSTEVPSVPETPSTEKPNAPSVPVDPNAILLAEGISISTSYKVGERISGIAVGSTAEEVLKNIKGTNCTVKVQKADGSEQTGVIGTGNKVIISDGNGKILKSYEIVIFGDTNGDGKISNVDLVMLTKQILNISTLTDSYFSAADVSQDGKVSNKDLVALQKHILNITQITQ